MSSPQTAPEFPPPPRFGSASISDLLVSAASQWRPVAESDGAVVDFSDRLRLENRLTESGRNSGPYRNVCVILVDGLGDSLVRANLGYSPTLRKGDSLGTLDAVFPSTTAASLTALGTGYAPGQTGMVGYDVVDPERRVVVNQLSGWDPAVDPRVWQPHPTVLQRLEGLGEVVTVSMPAYQGTPLTEAALSGGRFEGASSTLARVSKAVELLNSRRPTFMYLYWGELDQIGHRYGSDSARWLEALEELESGLKRLTARTGEETLLLLSADHGMVDIPVEDRWDYSAFPELVEGVELTAGEPRMVQLHLENPDDAEARERLRRAWQERFGDRAWVLDREELVAAGYFGESMREGVTERIGDLIIAAHGSLALYDLRRSNLSALEMVGQHGSWTPAEREIPLIALNH